MARTAGTISVGADTRQLERDIQNALSKDFRFKGFNEKAFTQPLGRITGAANEFQKSLDASNARVIAFGASAGLIYTVERAFTDLIKTTINVQKSLTDINVILNTTSEGLVKFGQRLFDIAKNTGQSFQTVAGAATELARQGLGVEETLKRASDALILTRLSGLDAVSAVEALTATINSFNKTALDSTTIINKLANVDAAFAVSSADLANALQRVGSSAQDVGVNFDELLAIVTSVQQTTARGGAVIGNSLKTIFTRIQRTDVLDQLQALGLNVRDLEGNTLPAIYILKQLAGTFDSLGDAQRSQIAELVGGVFQINVLKAALGDLGKEYSIYDRALQTSATATDQAIKRNEALNQTLSALFNSTLQNITQLGATIGGGAFQPAIEGSLKNINKLLEVINTQDSESFGAKLGEGILRGLSTFISGPGIVLITAVIGKLLLDLTKFAASGAKALLGINQQATIRAQLQSKINEVLLKEPEILAAINAKQISVLDVERRILGILKEQNALRAQAATLSSSISGGLIAKGVSVSNGQITTKTKSQGFIPNFVMSEVYGALSGGYIPGDIKKINIPGEGNIVYNGAETIKKFPGMKQPAIMPPLNSKAGKEYKKNFISQNSFDPYASEGFAKGLIPNFANQFGKYYYQRMDRFKPQLTSNQQEKIWAKDLGQSAFDKSPIKFPSAGLSPDQAYGANRIGKFKDNPDWRRKGYSEFVLDPVLGGKLIDKRWGRSPTREQRLKRIEKSRENREAFRLIQDLPISPSVLSTLNFYKNKKSYQYDTTGKMQIYKSADGNISLHEVRSHEYSGNESNGISVENGKLVLEDYSPDSDKKLSFNPEFKKLISRAGSALGLGVIPRSELTKILNTSNIAKIRDNPLYRSEGYIPNFYGLADIRRNLPMNAVKDQYKIRRYLKEGYELLGGDLYERADLRSNRNLFKDGTLVEVGAGEKGERQILVKSSKKGLIVSQLRQKELDTAKARGKKDGAKLRKQYVYVYPDSAGGGVPFYTGGKSEKTGVSYQFQAFPFPGAGEKIPDELYNDISNSLVQNAKKFIAGVSTRPEVVDQKLFEQYVKSNLSRSAVESATGQVFEASVKAAIKRVTFNETGNFDLDQGELRAIARRFKSSKALLGFSAGDFKNSLSESNLDSFADKIATKEGLKPIQRSKNKAKGFIPNFSPLKKAMDTEKALGGKPVLDYKDGIGFYVRDKKTQPNFGAVMRDHPEGMQNAIKNSRIAQNTMSKGFIPNLAKFLEPDLGPITGMGAEQAAQVKYSGVFAGPFIKQAESEFRQIAETLRDQKISLNKANGYVLELAKKYGLSSTSVENMSMSLKNVAKTTSAFNTKVVQLERTASGIFGSGMAELKALGSKPGERGQTAKAALERAQEARAAKVQRYQNIGIGASIGVPILAQTLAQAAPNNKNVQATAEGLGTAASFAGAGALFGPWGAAIGGVIGGLVGLKKALGIINDRTEEFAKKASLAANDLARFGEDVQTFLSTRGQLQAIESGEIRASPQEIKRLRKNEATALARVYNASSPQQREQIKTALSSGDEDTLKEAFGRSSIAKDSAKGIADFNQAIRTAEKESKLTTETFEENIIALGNLRTRSGDTFADLIYKNQNVMDSLNKYVLTADSFARVTEYAQKSVDEFGKSIEGSFNFEDYQEPDLFGFNNRLDLQKRNQQADLPPSLPFSEEEINKKVRDLISMEGAIAYSRAMDAAGAGAPVLSKEQDQANQMLRNVLKERAQLMGGTDISGIRGLSEDYQKSIAIEVLAREKAQENFKKFSDTLSTFVTDLGKNGEISQAEAKDINETISKVLNIPGKPQEKMEILVEKLRDLGVEGEKLAQIVNNVVKFSFSSLSRSLQDLFQKRAGDESPEGQIIASERKTATIDFLKNAKFEDLFNDLSYKNTGIDAVLGKTVQDTIGKVLSGTVDETKRKTEIENFQKYFVSQLEDITKGSVPLELALAKITTQAERTAISSSLTSDNLTELARSISNRAERENALNKYIEIEAKLREEFKDDIDGLSRATESAKLKLIAFADAATGKGFREDLNAKLLEASRLDILNNKFTGLDLNEMGKIAKVDYQNIVRTTGAETISAINQGVFDPATKQKLINQAIAEQEKMLAKIDAGEITTKDISSYRARNKTIQDSSQILIQSYDKINQSLYTVNGQQQARIAIENQLRNLEEEYKDNLEALNRVAPQLVDKLVALAGVKEGSVFAEEYKAVAEAERTARIREGKFKPTDPFEAFSDEMLYSSQDMARDANSIFTDTARTMKSEFNNAFQSIIDGTGTVDDAFRSMGLNIARRIQQLTQEMATNALFNSLFSNIGGIPSLFKDPMGGGGGLFGFAKGGVVTNNSVKRFSQGGKVFGGSGTKDDVPALLSRGEYVIKKSAVSKYGEPFLRKLNQGGFLQFADGGYANYNPPDAEIDQMMANAKINPLIINGKEAQGRIVTKEMVGQFQETIDTLIKEKDISFSDQNSTWNTFRDTFGGGLTAELGNIYTYNDDLFPTGGSNILDPRLSDLARTDPNNPQSKTIQDKRNRLIDYLAEAIGIYYDNRNNAIDTIRQNLEERDRINQINAENRARVDQMNKQARDAYNQQKRNAILGGLLNAGIIAGTGLLNMAGGVGGLFKQAGSFFGGLFGGSSNRLPSPTASNSRLSTSSYYNSASSFRSPSSSFSPLSSRLSPSSYSSSNLSLPSQRLSVPSTPYRSPYNTASVSFRDATAPNTYNSLNRQMNTPIGGYNYGVYNRANGGIIGFAKGGSSGKDDIPAMLMGGEYVMRKDTVDLYGKSFFDDLNAGKIRKFAEGGFVNDNNKVSPSDKSTETSTTMQGNISNNISISINIDRNGNSSETETSGSSGSSNTVNNQTNSGLRSEKEAKDLSEKIKTEVVRIITEQQRPGGMLSSSVYRKVR